MAPLIGQFSTLEAAEATFGAPGWTAVLADTMVYGYNVPENAVNLYFKSGRLIFVAAVPYVD